MCGGVGKNPAAELRREIQGNSCACEKSCGDEVSCMGWSFVPKNLGLFGMGENDCVLHSDYIRNVSMQDVCGGQCRMGGKYVSNMSLHSSQNG